MAGYGNPGPDLYSDAAPKTEAPAAPEAKPKEESAKAEGTAEIPLSVMGGKEWKPGEEIVLEIVQMTENGAVVKYASEKGGEGEGYGGEEAAPAPAAAPQAGPMSSMLE